MKESKLSLIYKIAVLVPVFFFMELNLGCGVKSKPLTPKYPPFIGSGLDGEPIVQPTIIPTPTAVPEIIQPANEKSKKGKKNKS